ncbi:hypothetical protein CVT24_000987 [Panaeolus cyanescens]|uniref:Uncharacterized protein n=1 Tax=Panaeolus cyanescens TaxID=181874 RepID=A0A409YCG4_9AGAR|nr:hypothetical protein CVT24_000987 [Panaeolus cyanescens]
MPSLQYDDLCLYGSCISLSKSTVRSLKINLVSTTIQTRQIVFIVARSQIRVFSWPPGRNYYLFDARISSMYNHAKKIIILLGTAFIFEMVSLFGIQVSAFKAHFPVPGPAPGLHFCTHASIPPWFWAIWIPIMVFELLMLGLTLRVAYIYYKTAAMQENIGETEPRQKSLAYVLFRDSIFYPFLAVLVCIANFVSWLRLSHSAVQITVAVAAWLPCILGCRLILNLREAYYQPFEKEMQETDEEQNNSDDMALQIINTEFTSVEDVASPRGSSSSVLHPRLPPIPSRPNREPPGIDHNP